jgi:uncharacterized protein (TIGR03085 family)
VDWQPPHRRERLELCDLALQLGPDAPTLCEGWTVAHLLGHLDVREHSALGAAGIVAPALERFHEAGIERTLDRHGFDGVVLRVRTGPPWHLRPLDATINLTEMFVHHEDLRRGAGDHAPRPPARVQATEAALWERLPSMARLLTRRVPVPLVLHAPGLGEVRTGGDGPGVTVTGSPGELVLLLFGRRAAAQVELAGGTEALTALAAADLGI